MLKAIAAGKVRAGNARFAIVASEYNSRYVDGMLRAARAALKKAGARNTRIIRVPGAYEIPVVASRLARTAFADASSSARPSPFAIICLGVVLRGETTHAAHIAEAVSHALMELQLRYEIPIVHGVLLLENEQQARVRCLGAEHNRGTEAAHTALRMARIMA